MRGHIPTVCKNTCAHLSAFPTTDIPYNILSQPEMGSMLQSFRPKKIGFSENCAHQNTYLSLCLIYMYSYYLCGQEQPLCTWMINEMCKKPHRSGCYECRTVLIILCIICVQSTFFSPRATPFKSQFEYWEAVPITFNLMQS